MNKYLKRKGLNTMETTKTITITTQEIKHDKKTFYVSSSKIGEKWYKIKFRQECENAPKKAGKYHLTINFDDCSIEKGGVYTNKKGKELQENDSIWVHRIVEIVPVSEEELREENRQKMSAIFE